MKLYHYTDGAAVKSIIEKEELWLTDLRFVNDAEELKHGIALALRYLNTLGHGLDYDAKSSVEYVIAELKSYLENISPPNNMFSCSFSTVPGLLSQWRSYGTLAIEFDQALLERVLPVVECSYDSDDSYRFAVSNTAEVLNACLTDFKAQAGFASGAEQAFKALLTKVAQIKHPSFKEEQERRVIVSSKGRDIHHRCRGNLFIPYVAVKVPRESIINIHVGPQANQRLVVQSVMSMLTACDPDKRIGVGEDSTPYRAH